MSSIEMRCEEVEQEELVQRFLAGTLSPERRERFEAHAIFCNHCQRSLEIGVALRAALRATPSSVAPSVVTSSTAPRDGSAGPTPWGSWTALAGIAALMLAMVLLRAPGAQNADRTSPLGALTQPPVYLGVAVRADNVQGGEVLFDSAMRAYNGQRFQEAATGLRAAIGAGFDNAPAHFFLGASLLMSQQPRDAVAAFSSVLESGDTPYETEALYYRAKGWLQLQERARALEDLDKAAARTVDISTHARALRDSVSGAAPR